MKPSLSILTGLLAALTLIVPAGADDCVPSTFDPTFDTADVAGTGVGAPADVAGRYYVDAFVCPPTAKCMNVIWVYQEANGIDGLQRQDEIVDNTCNGQIPGDTIVF